MSKELDQKVQAVFGDVAIDRGLVQRLGVSGDDRHVPSYVMDWIITRESKNADGTTQLSESVAKFIKDHLPSKGEKELVKHRLGQGDMMTILDSIKVRVKLDGQREYLAEIPCLDEHSAGINEDVVNANESLLLGATWGAARIMHDEDNGGICIVDFKPMQSGTVSLHEYQKCRQQFTTREWLDLIIQSIGYNPDTYSEEEKIWMLCRLIPVVHNRVNMMELAPPGSGKSYLFNNISRHVWLTSAQITPAVLFYNRQRRTPGLLTKYDLLVLDEAQSIRFSDPAEIEAQLKGYLEQGVYARGDIQATAECGMMLLANIDLSPSEKRYMNGQPALLPRRSDYIRKLPEMFQQSPLLDRFHGIIPGWKIPPFNSEQQAVGWGLKSDYFAAICHELRRASGIAQKVRPRLGISSGYKRDRTAIERTACALAKLLLIDVDDPDFEHFIVRPAMELRRLVRTQLSEVDHSFNPALQIELISKIDQEDYERIGKYLVLEPVTTDGTAEVFKGYDPTSDSIVAIKRVREGQNDFEKRSIQREIQIYEKLKEIPHPNILQFHEVVHGDESYSIVMEYADGGNLWEKIVGESDDDDGFPPLNETDVIQICLPIIDAVQTMHENGIIHRDIKPQNILCSDDCWKLSDFGISKWTETVVTGFTFQGAHTSPWAPREQMEGAEAHPSADVYALGRLLSFLLTGKKSKTAIQDGEDFVALAGYFIFLHG
jgi:ATP-dependent Lon protease